MNRSNAMRRYRAWHTECDRLHSIWTWVQEPKKETKLRAVCIGQMAFNWNSKIVRAIIDFLFIAIVSRSCVMCSIGQNRRRHGNLQWERKLIDNWAWFKSNTYHIRSSELLVNEIIFSFSLAQLNVCVIYIEIILICILSCVQSNRQL